MLHITSHRPTSRSPFVHLSSLLPHDPFASVSYITKTSCRQSPQLYLDLFIFSTLLTLPPPLFHSPPFYQLSDYDHNPTSIAAMRFSSRTDCSFSSSIAHILLLVTLAFTRCRQPPTPFVLTAFTLTYSCAARLFSFGCLLHLFFLTTTCVCTYSRIGPRFD